MIDKEDTGNIRDDEFWLKVKSRYDKYLKRKGLVRIGHCNKCGDCCRNTLVLEVNTKRYWYRIIGKEDKHCTHFDESTNKCKCHDNDKPILCKLWPMKPSDLKWFPNCGYKFIREKDDRED